MTLVEKKQLSEKRARASWVTRLSLRQRILLLLCLAALPGIAVAVFLATSWLREQTQQIEITVERLARLAAARHDTVIERARALLAGIAQGYQANGASAANCGRYLIGWTEQFPAFTSLTLYGQQGSALCSASESELPLQAADRPWFDKVQSEKSFVLGDYAVGRSGKPLLVAAYPVLSPDREVAAIIALGIDLGWLDFLAKTIKLPDRATITAVNTRGELLSHNAVILPQDAAKPTYLPSQDAIERMVALASGTLRAADVGGNPRLYGFQHTTSANLIVAVGLPPYLEHAHYRDALLHTLASPLLVLVLALLAAGYASEAFVTRYVRSLTRTAEAIEEGDLSARTDIPYDRYEIGKLAAAFDSMAVAIERNQEELEGLVEERDMLIRELNHRVKNNLQIVLAMLRGDGATTPDKAQERLRTLAGRVQTLAQIHQLLYQRYDTAAPQLTTYVQRLARLLGEFYGANMGPAQIDAEVSAVDLTIGQCISFGLILNELVANAQKHAFPEGQAGRITIRIVAETLDGVDYVHLIVSDNGVGLPADFDLVEATSTGARIIRALAQQLGGEVWGERLERGTAMHVRFPANPGL